MLNKHGKQSRSCAKCCGIITRSTGAYCGELLGTMGSRRGRSRLRSAKNRRHPVDNPSCHCLLKAKHRGEPRGMLAVGILTTWPRQLA
jgi:hypothetical protein